MGEPACNLPDFCHTQDHIQLAPIDSMRLNSRNELNVAKRRPELDQTLKILESALFNFGRVLLWQNVFPSGGVFPVCKIQHVPEYFVYARVWMPQNADRSPALFLQPIVNNFKSPFELLVSVRAFESAVETDQILVIVVEAQHAAIPVRTVINVHNIGRIQVDTDSELSS